MRSAAFRLLLLPLLLAVGCRPSLPTEDPAAVVQQFFAAIAAGDCARVLASLGAPYRQKVGTSGCPELVQKLRRFPLDQVLAVTPDGRSHDARLVRTRLVGHRTETIIRLQAESGHWKIFAL